jgi:hypothetical protein
MEVIHEFQRLSFTWYYFLVLFKLRSKTNLRLPTNPE